MAHCCVCNEPACDSHIVGALAWCVMHQKGREVIGVAFPGSHRPSAPWDTRRVDEAKLREAYAKEGFHA